MRTLLALTAAALAAHVANAQTPPPAGTPYFGAPKSAAFTPTDMFGKPPPPAPPPVAIPADPPAVAGPDGGLFPAPPPPVKLWKGSLEAGVTGATGNSDVFNARLGWNAERKTADNLLFADFLYQNGRLNGRTIQNAALFNARHETLFAGSPWTLFGSTNIEYDELRVYEFRVGVYAGVGYTVADDGSTLFKLRAGAGAVREIGGPQDRWVPEMVFGYDLRHRFTDRQSFVSTLDFYPRIDDFAMYRVRARAAYEVVIDPASGMAFRIGAQSRYDSDPGAGAKRHDLNYFATLAMNF